MIQSKHNLLLGQKFGRWTIIDISHSSKAICKCSCGSSTKSVNIYTILSGKSLSCGCIHKEQLHDRSYNGTKDISGSQWAHIKCCAKIRNIDFILDIKDAQKLLELQNYLCWFSGIKLETAISKHDIQNIGYNLSLDRLDSKLIYSKENCRWVHKDINIMKYTLTEEEFLNCCRQIYLFQQGIYKPEKRVIEIYKFGHNFNGYKNIRKYYITQTKNGAISRNLTFNISIEDVWEQYIKQNGICTMCGLNIDFMPPGENQEQTVSIDRIDSKKGYEKDNIQLVHKDLNRMRMKLSIQDFYNYVYKIVKYRKLA